MNSWLLFSSGLHDFSFIGFQELCEVGSVTEQPAGRPWPVWIFSFVFCYFKEVRVQKTMKHFIIGLVREFSLISHVSFFPASDIHRTAVVLCSLDQHFLQRNENIALLKAQKAKTVASGFKVTELVNFLVCFAELNEKDLIECYCLGISINNHKNPPVVIFFPLCICKLWSRTWIIIVNWTWMWEIWNNWIKDFDGGEQLFQERRFVSWDM